MSEQWKFETGDNGGVILGVEGCGKHLQIPEFLGGNCVREICPYAFRNQRQILSAGLPSGMERLGAHCFYDCRGLQKISLTDSVMEIGDGAFKNCMELHQLSYTVEHGNMRGLKGILSELNQSFFVELFYRKPSGLGEGTAKLIFPQYVYDYEENTMARIINQVTYGCGVHYRECLSESGIDYRKYDRLFSYANVNGKAEDNRRIALLRLLYPYELEEAQRAEYAAYLSANWEEALKDWIGGDSYQEFSRIVDMDFVEEAMIKTALAMTQAHHKTEWTAKALQVKRERFGGRNRRFVL